MPHTDNLLGYATVASLGMFAAVAAQPWTGSGLQAATNAAAAAP